MGVMAWDSNLNKWNSILPGKSGDKNEDYRSWGKPVYAMVDGMVVQFKNDIPNNPKPGTDLSPPQIVEGNHFYIQHGDELALYAHLQKGSLNSNFLTKGAHVNKGDFLGLSGYSGNGTGNGTGCLKVLKEFAFGFDYFPKTSNYFPPCSFILT